jgi:hypothetical protein
LFDVTVAHEPKFGRGLSHDGISRRACNRAPARGFLLPHRSTPRFPRKLESGPTGIADQLSIPDLKTRCVAAMTRGAR